MTAPALSRTLEVSVRTIYRDVETLSIAGVPIYATAGKGGGISLLPGYTFDKTLLSDTEQKQLLFAIQSLKAADQTMDGLLQKLGGAFQKSPQNWIEVDFSRWGKRESDSIQFERLKIAILEKEVLRLTYSGAVGEISQREIHPLRLVYKDKHWYLQAFCLRADDFRLFKLGRMVEMNATGENFSVDYDGEIPPIETREPLFSTVQMRLRIGASLAFRVYDEFERKNVALQPDGSFLVDATYPMDQWVMGYLFSFGTELEIISPVQLREQLGIYAEKIAEHHKT